MYRLLSGLHAHLTRKEEFNVIILGLDQAGKTTFLEKVKTIYSPSHPGLNPSQIVPTMGQNIGRITLSSSHLQFWDLGGSREIRPIWEKYYKEADAICWVIDSCDRIRNGRSDDTRNSNQTQGTSGLGKGKGKAKDSGNVLKTLGEGWMELQKVLQHPSIAQANLPLLVVANKQDGINLRERRPEAGPSRTGKQPVKNEEAAMEGLLDGQEGEEGEEGEEQPMGVDEVKELFNRLVMESDRSEKARALGLSEAHVVGVSSTNGQGVQEAVNWLFYRVASKGQSRKTLAAAAMGNAPPETSRSSGPTTLRPVRLGTMSKGLNTPAISRTNSYQPK
ncbi:hypothetical protein CROQUDRAFT_651635 [Cronartium quercuum f. sp. fusiforme G11]|uniref:ADP-ribosylation factor-like protein 3 n=1 Tax=Cronartium quercuum f. sp. fusiforme G11 TaxID=708437 RepID=A0A9P6NT24_9BASI|nr:hypothetical protein CROQUDRAFT_651635 [Cronartium quercuum f. sp. fusiforme G11]